MREGSTTKTSTRGDPSIRGRSSVYVSLWDRRVSIVSIPLVEARVGTRESDESIGIPVCSLDHQRRFSRPPHLSHRPLAAPLHDPALRSRIRTIHRDHKRRLSHDLFARYFINRAIRTILFRSNAYVSYRVSFLLVIL